MRVYQKERYPLMKIKLTSLAILAAFSGSSAVAAVSSDDGFTYSGNLQQGGFIKGHFEQCISYELNDIVGRCDESGRYVLGFGRDAKLKQVVTFTFGGGKTIDKQFNLLSREYKVQRIEGVAKKMVSPAASSLARIKKDNVAIAKARQVDSDLTGFSQSFIWPAQGRISGVYGSQRVFNGVPKRPHFGLDVAGKTGTPVIAPADGIVSLAVEDMYYSGGTLLLDHGYGLSSTFIHLSALEVPLGAKVKQGQLIGRIGATGRVTGPHLDWRINWFSERLDPAFWVKPGGNKAH